MEPETPFRHRPSRNRLHPRRESQTTNSNQIVEVNGHRRIIYEKKKFLGSGTFAKVYFCIRTDTRTKHAIKIVSKKRLKGKPEIKNQV